VRFDPARVGNVRAPLTFRLIPTLGQWVVVVGPIESQCDGDCDGDQGASPRKTAPCDVGSNFYLFGYVDGYFIFQTSTESEFVHADGPP